MAKIHPADAAAAASVCSSSSSFTTSSNKETFTIWMKSLVFNGNGCTVYDSQGGIIYRMDNYDDRHNKQVHLMDLKGKLLFTVRRRKKFGISRCWEAYKCNQSNLEEENPWFRVKTAHHSLKGDASCQAIMNLDIEQTSSVYRIQGLPGKVACKIVNQTGELVAEIMQKQSTSGITLGDDVMKLVVEPNEDHLLVMAFLVVCSLMNHRM